MECARWLGVMASIRHVCWEWRGQQDSVAGHVGDISDELALRLEFVSDDVWRKTELYKVRANLEVSVMMSRKQNQS